jgi:hypothetical protein
MASLNDLASASKHRFTKGKPIIKPSHEGLLHKNLGVKAGDKIPAAKLAKAAHSSNPAIKKRAIFAQNTKKWSH